MILATMADDALPIAHLIQLALAPVFLLTGVGSILNVLTARLNRIVDRARLQESRWAQANEAQRTEIYRILAALSQRMRLINWAIGLCVVCAVLICVVVAIMFISQFSRLDFSQIVAGLFIGAMAALTVGLVLFLREILIATASVRIGIDDIKAPSGH
ncbi:DUF2721 domain-containing protein [Parapedomonas caeni]|jgi:putative exporter of polyketide antibiotics